MSKISARSRKKAILRSYIPSYVRVQTLKRELVAAEDKAVKEAFLKEKKKLDEMLLKIERAVDDLPVRERSVLWKLYIGEAVNGRRVVMKMWQVGNELGYATETIKKIHGSALEHIRL